MQGQCAPNLQTDWGILSDSNSRFTALYPPTLYLTGTLAPGIFFLGSSPGGVVIGGGAPPPGSSEATIGFAVTFSAVPYAPSGDFDINQYLSMEYPDSVADVSSITPTSIGSQTGYVFTFQNEDGGGKPVAIVYYGGHV